MLKNAFYSSLVLHRKNSKAKLDNLLLCYRYFKESRNCLVHRGGIADTSAEQAYLAFSAVATTADLGVSEVPNHSVVTLNSPIHLSLRGIVGFCDVVLRMIATIDAELSRAESAEKVFHQSWLNKHGKKYALKRPGRDARQAQITRLVQKLGYPSPSTTTAIEKYLLDNDLAR